MSRRSLKVDVVTIFPDIFSGFLGESIIKRAQEKGLVRIRVVNLRDYTADRHRTVDDRPFGGGAGMVFKPEPVFKAVEDLATPSAEVVLLSPRGRKFDQEVAVELSRKKHLILISGHYEGVDERIRRGLATDEISLGDFILTGGALPAMVVIDCVVRLIPGVLGHPDSIREESFASGRLEYPHYTRPTEFRGMKVPEVLLSGDHQAIARWRRRQAFINTFLCRPDLLEVHGLTAEERTWLKELKKEQGRK